MLICDWCKGERVPAVYTNVVLSTVGDDGEVIDCDEHADLCDACRRSVRREVKAIWKKLAPKVKTKR